MDNYEEKGKRRMRRMRIKMSMKSRGRRISGRGGGVGAGGRRVGYGGRRKDGGGGEEGEG